MSAVERLLEVTARLDAPRIFERSTKFSPRRIDRDRGLVSLHRRALYPGGRRVLAETCAALDIVDIAPLMPWWDMFISVHFGADGPVTKCYLELPQGTGETVFVALKHAGGRGRLTTYDNRSKLPHPQKIALVRERAPVGEIAGFACDMLELARSGDPDGQAVLLEVKEMGTGRASVDISLADAALSLDSISDAARTAIASLDVDPDAIFIDHGGEQLGHVAAGVSQSGTGFLTLYHGARGL